MTDAAGMAPFERVAELIRNDIRRGKLRPGDKLPPHRELAEEHGVALATTQKALRALQDEGWLNARQSIGVFVSDNRNDRGEPVTLASLSQQLNELAGTVSKLEKRVASLENAPNENQAAT